MSEPVCKKTKYQMVLNKIIDSNKEYIKKITDWDKIEIVKNYLDNIEKFMQVCKGGYANSYVCYYERNEIVTPHDKEPEWDFTDIVFLNHSGRYNSCIFSDSDVDSDNISEDELEDDYYNTFLLVKDNYDSFIKYLESYFKDTGFIVRSKYESCNKFAIKIECNLDNVDLLALS